MIPAEAVEAAANISGAAILAVEAAVFDAMIEHGSDGHTDGHDKIARAALEAAAPHMLARDESKLAAIIFLLDPFERATKWMATDDEAGIYAIEAVNKIRAILDTP